MKFQDKVLIAMAIMIVYLTITSDLNRGGLKKLEQKIQEQDRINDKFCTALEERQLQIVERLQEQVVISSNLFLIQKVILSQTNFNGIWKQRPTLAPQFPPQGQDSPHAHPPH